LAPTRHHYVRYEANHLLNPDAFASLHQQFRDQACALAQAMGMFNADPGTTTHPSVENVLTGDGTVVRPRVKARRGDIHLNPMTGELEPRRYDPDAADYATWDPDNEKSIVVRGIKFGLIFGHHANVSNQRVVLDVFHVPTGDGGEAARALDSITGLVEYLGPGAQGVCWDMAMRGTHKDHLYHLGLMPIIKTVKTEGGKDKTAQLGPHNFTLADGTVEYRQVFTQAGAPLIEVIVGGNRVPVFLTRNRTRRVAQRTTGFRWFNDYTVPDEAPVPQQWRGATVRIRLNHSAEHAPTHNRAEVISAVAEHDPDWQRLYASRPVAESVNSLFKRSWYKNRAPRIGANRNHASLICAALWNNYRAWLEYTAANSQTHPPEGPLGAREQRVHRASTGPIPNAHGPPANDPAAA
jgi:hypothetical protein